MYELDSILKYVDKKQDLDALYIGLDFLMFTDKRSTMFDFATSPFNEVNEDQLIARYLVGTSPFKSLSTFRRSFHNQVLAKEHQNGLLDKSKVVTHHIPLFKKTLKSNFLINRGTYREYQLDPERLNMLRNAVKRFTSKGTKCHLFINPIHAYQLEAIHGMGLWEEFQDWKTQLVLMTTEANLSSDNKVTLWDFAYHNLVTKEPVRNSPMQWFWESSHYKQKTGKLILHRILGLDNEGNFGLGDRYSMFGQRLNQQNINSHLKANNLGHKFYHQSNAKDVDTVMNWIQETSHVHQQAPKRSFN